MATDPNAAIYDAIRKADAAGDAESVARLSGFIKQQSGGLSPGSHIDEQGVQRSADGTLRVDITPNEPPVKPDTYTPSQLMLSKATMGLSDKGQALLERGIGALTGSNKSYSDYLAEIDAGKQAYRDAHPAFDWLTLPVNLLGAARAPIALANPMSTAAANGAAYGFLGGVGQSRGPLGQQAAETAFSTGAGALLGPVLAGAGNLAGRAVNYLRGIESPTDAGSVMLRTLQRQGTTPQEAAQIIDEARANGVPMALMDTGDEMRGLASSLARKPGANRSLIRDVAIPRQEAQGERIQSAIERDLGPIANVRDQSEALIGQARADAAPLYTKAYAAPVVSTPRLESLLNTPAGKAALSKAATIAANEERNPAALGFSLDSQGNVVLNPVPEHHLGALGAAESNAFAAEEALKRAQTAQLTGGNGSNLSVAQAQADHDAAQQALAHARANLAAQPMPGTAATRSGYTTQTLDYVKRGLDDVIESHRDTVTGRLRLDEGLRAINGVRARFLNEVDRINPDYAPARAAYAGPASMASALSKGSKVINKDAQTIIAETKNLTPAELDQYRLGARSAISGMLDGRVDAADKVKALVGSPRKRLALTQLFGGADNFDRFLTTLSQEGQANATYGRVALGSPTAANLADDTNLDGLTGVAVNAGARALGGQGVLHNAISTARDVMQYGLGKSGERLRAELAAGISETHPQALEVALAQARRAEEISRLRAQRLITNAPGAGVVGGQSASAALAALAPPSQ